MRWLRRRGGFTLVELLAVVAIMGILFTLALAAFQNIKARGMTGAVVQLSSSMRLARQHAITKNTTVWMVFPDLRDTIYSDDPGSVDKAAKAYAVVASNRVSQRIEYISSWTYLPAGVVFLVDESFWGGNNPFSSYSSGGQAQYPFPNDKATQQRLCALMFRSNGRVYRFSRTSNRWISTSAYGNKFSVPLTTARFVQVNTNTGQIVSYTNIEGETNMVEISSLTGIVQVPKR